MLIKNAEINRNDIVDLRCENGLITEIGRCLQTKPSEKIINAKGGALLPGLHDHHIHLYAFAAAHSSVTCGPPEVCNLKQLAQALNENDGSNWLRGIAYHDSVAGEIDRWQLDKLINDRPVRIQHRSGKMWIVNSIAADILELEENKSLDGIECDDNGRPNGRLFRLDEWLRSKMGGQSRPDLKAISALLASYGVTGITDATPSNSSEEVLAFSRAIEEKHLLQRVLLMGTMELPQVEHSFIKRGALKILLDEHSLPDLDEFTQRIIVAHAQQRPVAVHCVTRTELVFALSALGVAGYYPGDRIEHASVTPDEVLPLMKDVQVTIVTQHGFINKRGDQYLIDVKPEYHELLYRGKSFLDAGIPLAGSSDAPYGSSDPWLAMRAAVNRSSAVGEVIGKQEGLTPEQALALFTGPADFPGNGARKIVVGEGADLCVLDRCWQLARERLDSDDVMATIRDGELIYCR